MGLLLAIAAEASPAPGTPQEKASWPPISPSFKDLAYGQKSPAEKLDLYLPPPGSRPAPLVIWIHGGAFQFGDKKSMPRKQFGPPPKARGPFGPFQVQVPNAAALVAKGYAVASLNYRLGPSFVDAALPAVQDGKAAVRYLRANAARFHLDPDRFALWGNSAGGYMAVMIGVTGDQASPFDDPSFGNASVSAAVQACIIWYGAEDRLPDELLATTYIATARRLPPFRIVNGDADPIISVEQVRGLYGALKAAKAEASLAILPGAGHEDPLYMETQMEPSFAFLDRVLKR